MGTIKINKEDAMMATSNIIRSLGILKAYTMGLGDERVSALLDAVNEDITEQIFQTLGLIKLYEGSDNPTIQ